MTESANDDGCEIACTEVLKALMAITSDTDRVDSIRAKDGTEIPLRVFEGGSGTPVVMLHGLYSHSGWFMQSAAFLASQGCSVYSFDRRGWGLSRECRGHTWSFRDLLDEIDAVVNHAMNVHAVGRVHLLGHCLGALPATVFACDNPGKIDSLILSTPGIYTHVAVPLLRKAQTVTVGALGGKSPIPLRLKPEELADLEIHRQFIATDSLAVRNVTASFYFCVFAAKLLLMWKVRRLHVPTFVALAGKDTVSDNPRTIAFLRRSPAEKRIVMYPEATHILEYSVEKNRYFADLAGWIRRGSPD
ncbi:MAG: alpha/beta fold hydrolase [Phycisphaerales bacterium]